MEGTDLRYGMRRKYAEEERFHLKEDIREPFLPFVRLLSVSHLIHFRFTWSFYPFVEVIHYRIRFHYLFLFL